MTVALTSVLILVSLIEIVLIGYLALILNRYKKDVLAEWRLWQDIKMNLAERAQPERKKELQEVMDWMEL